MKIAHAQLHMYTNIMYKFQSSMCKTDGQRDGQPWQFQYTPSTSLYVMEQSQLSTTSKYFLFFQQYLNKQSFSVKGVKSFRLVQVETS